MRKVYPKWIHTCNMGDQPKVIQNEKVKGLIADHKAGIITDETVMDLNNHLRKLIDSENVVSLAASRKDDEIYILEYEMKATGQLLDGGTDRKTGIPYLLVEENRK
ncbi:hypothetical protein [Psychrobacillus sp.]|uniref:hypothetical protein n=1 Tax=Psychrobacillus sp. TaxID=1871623 RepID=UPI0028BEFF55|nr:hypothetical protein [Psychrobacillus sp.]